MVNNRKYASPLPTENVLKKEKTNVIIQCPKCQTKFSVSSELISELELPRFHCSRCDNVFDMDPRTSASFEESDIEAAKVNAEEITVEPMSSRTMEISKDTLSQLSDMIKSEVKKTAEDIESEAREAEKEAPAVHSLQIPSTYSPAAPASAPIEKISDFKTDQLSMNLGFENQSKATTDFTMPYGVSVGKPFGDFSLTSTEKLEDSTQEMNTDSLDYETPSYIKSAEQPMRLSNIGNSSAPRWSGPTIIIMPILFTLFIASMLSFMLVRSPDIAEAVADNLGMTLEKFPPPGLYLESLKFNNYILDNGERVVAISGKIKNDSPNKLKAVVLEGFAFNKDGALLGNVKLNAGSSLNDAKIKSLSLEMIQSLIKTKGGKKSEIAANSHSEFIIPFSNVPSADLLKAKFFSARIHSVTM